MKLKHAINGVERLETTDDVRKYVNSFIQLSKRGMEKAGIDGDHVVEKDKEFALMKLVEVSAFGIHALLDTISTLEIRIRALESGKKGGKKGAD